MASWLAEARPLINAGDEEEDDDEPLLQQHAAESGETASPPETASSTQQQQPEQQQERSESGSPEHPLSPGPGQGAGNGGNGAADDVRAGTDLPHVVLSGEVASMQQSSSDPAPAVGRMFTGQDWMNTAPPSYERSQEVSQGLADTSSRPELNQHTVLTPAQLRLRRQRRRKCCALVVACVVVAAVVALGVALGVHERKTDNTVLACRATQSQCPGGWVYDGVCLRSTHISARNTDSIPGSCTPYQPVMYWTIYDYAAICSHFTTNTRATCSNVDTDRDGGRCANHKAVLAFEDSHPADVWVARSTFTWNPTRSSQGNCDMLTNPPGTLVYACKHTCSGSGSGNGSSVAPTTCSGFIYKGYCLQSATYSYTSVDITPPGCTPIQPALSWTLSDYLAICRHYGTSSCTTNPSLYSGRCSTTKAILSFANSFTSYSRVWASSSQFSFLRSYTSCSVTAYHSTNVIYACAWSGSGASATYCAGYTYKGVCLRSSTTISSVSGDSVPAGCSPYSPAVSWSKSDFVSICQYFSGKSCSSVDTDSNGGRCSNFKALLAYENNANPDVWVNKNSFSWNPTGFSTPDCRLVYNPPGTIVYACYITKPTTSQPSTTCYMYNGVCLQSSVSQNNFDSIPSGCTPYQPTKYWSKSDYINICTHFGGSSACSGVDTDHNGGRCSNFRAVLSYENNNSPDVWVNRQTFIWDPTSSVATDDCHLVSGSYSTIVYACLRGTPQPTQPAGVTGYPSCASGFVYKGVCLRSSLTSTNSDRVPLGCTPYSPSVTWTFSDYQAICRHFEFYSYPGCSRYDSDRNGGKCGNHKALLSYERISNPDVWVNSASFVWNPTTVTVPDCNLVSGSPSRLVYACRSSVTPTVRSPFTSTASCGNLYKGVCLKVSTQSYISNDRIPYQCTPFQPTSQWTKADYVAICAHFGGSSNCGNVDRDRDGGKCSNFKALLSYETNSNPDVWVNNATFVWSPTSVKGNCALVSGASHLVYACLEGTTAYTVVPPNTTSGPLPTACSNSGYVHRGICLEAVSTSTNHDVTPQGCSPFTPPGSWTSTDFLIICSHFYNSYYCGRRTSSSYGGRCTNYRALLSFQRSSRPIVWVNGNTFSFNPSYYYSRPSCNLVTSTYYTTTVVYACRLASQDTSVTYPPVPGCTGYSYKGICLRSTFATTSGDQIPAGCAVFQPQANWTYGDYLSICSHFEGRPCYTYDSTYHGGRCVNFEAVLAYENNSIPDVWVNRKTFSWNPTSTSSSGDCTLISSLPGRIVYACDPTPGATSARRVCNGWTYKGVCLESSTATSSNDSIPAGCNAYHPVSSWTYTDFLAICTHFRGSSGLCSNYDKDDDGGRCSNYRAVLAFEDNVGPDVWVSYNTFTWNPTSSLSPNCKLLETPPGTLVYACDLDPPTLVPPVLPKTCPGWMYKEVCLEAVNASSNVDQSPSGCVPYQPHLSWQMSDFTAICQHFGAVTCVNSYSSSRNGGRCSNYRALLAYEWAAAPSFWVNSNSFGWRPSYYYSSTCNLLTHTEGTIVYACQLQNSAAHACPGYMYKGVCLERVRQSYSYDVVPSGCEAYQPSAAWTKSDYVAICQHFGGASDCSKVDTDLNGGRCSNYQALLSYEENNYPDVWVNNRTFAWNPTVVGQPDCHLVSGTSTVIYGCKMPVTQSPTSAPVPTTAAVTAAPVSTVPASTQTQGCKGWNYNSVCLMSRQLTLLDQKAATIVPPSSCSPYQPNKDWSFTDYSAICTHFNTGGGSNCASFDSDFNGGSCTNHQAVLAYENNGQPDVWVNNATFSWNPTVSETPDCNIQFLPGTVVFACKVN